MSKSNQRKLIAGLDIGSTAVRLAVGQLAVRDEENGQNELQILGASEVFSAGMNKGVISSIEDVVSSISACLEKTERIVGIPVGSVWLGVSGMHILAQASKGVVAVSKANSEVGEEDVTRVLESARAISTPLNYEVLHVLPKSFGVDGQTGIRDPVGMTGMRLEVDAQIILGASAQIKNLTKAVYRSGLEINDLILSILATSEAALTERQKELGVVMIDLGGSTTNLAVFEEGDMIHSAVLPVGSEHITNDLAIGLRTSVDIAGRVKTKYGDCFSEPVSKRDEIDLFEVGASDHEMVKKKYVSEIIEARAEEIMFKIGEELRKVQRSGLLPAGAVFAGGGAKLPGLIECAKKNLRLPATLGFSSDIASVTDKVNDLGFVTAVGLVKWGTMMGGRTTVIKDHFSGLNSIKGWIKNLLP
ncbi:MAG: cell division protein FtsA [Candidatus Magasanikbacteria bacterium RIFOXYC2_FULL_42_28]|uniref:Cell division protein FtsA n=1 Tax=Candidatus Magasanikbacteria bacterium RIFOXYC2_FULL_42_28 TaxID=1798704 RepID=A0A1F6NYJ9_9BACT|nr:MAG: cell division protein FtsA [Candidatus Magasanikbacteria bacterium RIFOXYC2_FULL_42_28]